MTIPAEIEAILEKAARLQVELWFEGDRLRYRAPGGALPEALRSDLSQRKAEILEVLRQRAAQQESVFPLSYGQQALWFLNQSDPSSAAYHVAFTGRVTSEISLDALRNALQVLLDRHSVLRARVVAEDGAPALRIWGYQPVTLECVEAAGWDETRLYAAVRAAYVQPMDLEAGPLLRAHLFSLGARDHVMLLTMHHIAVDGWSVWILLDELRALYAAAVTGKPANLPRPAATYQDYVEWQRAAVDGEQGEALWQFWRDMLSGDLPTLALPTDHPRPPVQTTNGGTVDFVLPAGLTQQLKALAKAEGATLYHLLFAAYQVLLQRYTGQADIITGLPTFGREKAEFARVVGDFINMLALRVSVEGDPPFRDFLAQVRRQVLDGLQHQDYPFPLLVARMGIPRDPSRSPLFQITFDVQRGQSGTELSSLFAPGDSSAVVQFGELALQPYPIPQQEGQFDLSLLMMDADTTIPGSFKYNRDLFERETVARIAHHYANLLSAIADDPGRPLSAYSMLADDERRRILVDWNATHLPYPREQRVHQLFEQHAAATPDAVALEFADQRLSYAELNARANQLARHLAALGIGPGQLVGVFLERSPEMLAAVLGVLKSGAAYVPMDPIYPAQRIGYMIEDSHMPLVITQSSLVDALPQQSARLVLVDGDAAAIAAHGAENLPVSGSGGDLAYVIFTSGSTGRPKGVQIPHRALTNFLLSMQQQPGIRAEDVLGAVTTLSFDIAGLELYLPLICGARVALFGSEITTDGTALAEAIRRHGVTILQATPATWRLLAESGWSGQPGLMMLCGGEALPLALAERLLGLGGALWNMYGPTETTIWSTCQQIFPGDERISIGRPIANTRAYILDAHLQPVPVGVAGTLYLGGDGLARGYLGREDLTAERFVPDPFRPGERIYNTGDLARFLPDGRIEHLGRADNQVKIRGYRIELGEIEAALGQHPAVQQAVVTVREDTPGHKRLVAYYTAPEAILPADLNRYLRDKLPAYMLPSVYVKLETLPRTPNGKIDRRALPAPESDNLETLPGARMASTPMEIIIADIWASILHRSSIGVHDNFFELGGHSLLAMRARNQIQSRLGCNLPTNLLFQHSSISELAAYLESRGVAVSSGQPESPVAAGVSQPPVPARNEDDPLSLLQNLDNLSDEDVSRLLESMNRGTKSDE